MIRRWKQLKDDRSGFTLVELIVAFAILAIVVVMVSLIIQTTGNTYRSISTDINLQYESQLAMSQLQEYIIDCNAYVAVQTDGGNKVLYVFNKTGDTSYEAYQFKCEDNVLYLNAKTMSTDDFLEDADKFIFNADKREPMSNYIDSFSVEVTNQQDEHDLDVYHAESVRLRLSYAAGNRQYQGEQIITLRNPVIYINTVT